MDSLSDVLQSLRLTGGVILEGHFSAPWCVSSTLEPEDFRELLDDPVHLIAYHYAASGNWWMQLPGEEPLEVRCGEAVLLPRNDQHLLGSSLALRPVTSRDLIQPAENGDLARIVHGGGGEAAQIFCGYIATDQPAHPLLAALPSVLKIDMGCTESDGWVESSMRFALQGLRKGLGGAATVMAKLSELMFVEAVRRYASALTAEQRARLAGGRDRYVAKALSLLHGRPDHPWSVESLASEVSLSRSAFCERFTAEVGMPPMRYLISWRLQMAKEKLREHRKPIAQIAHEVGYEAEAAFIRAFKREFGLPPATWRRQTELDAA